jgi:hypothetical protein
VSFKSYPSFTLYGANIVAQDKHAMCLYFSDFTNRLALKRLAKNGRMTIIKQFNIEFKIEDGKVIPIITTPYKNRPLILKDKEWFISNRLSTSLTRKEKHYHEVHKGIHSFTVRRNKSDHITTSLSICVRAFGYKEDFVAASNAGIYTRCLDEIVFTKIKIDLNDLKKQIEIAYKLWYKFLPKQTRARIDICKKNINTTKDFIKHKESYLKNLIKELKREKKTLSEIDKLTLCIQ